MIEVLCLRMPSGWLNQEPMYVSEDHSEYLRLKLLMLTVSGTLIGKKMGPNGVFSIFDENHLIEKDYCPTYVMNHGVLMLDQLPHVDLGYPPFESDLGDILFVFLLI